MIQFKKYHRREETKAGNRILWVLSAQYRKYLEKEKPIFHSSILICCNKAVEYRNSV